MAIRAFLSFVEEDLGRVWLFRAQAQSKRSDLEFEDCSVKETFDSVNSEYIKRGITEQIKRATLGICLYGPTTWTSPWVDWELRRTLGPSNSESPSWGCGSITTAAFNTTRVPWRTGPRVPWDIDKIISTMSELAREFRGTYPPPASAARIHSPALGAFSRGESLSCLGLLGPVARRKKRP